MLQKNNEKEDLSHLVDENSKQLQDETPRGSRKKPSPIIENISSQPKLLAWFSKKNNKISIAEIETQQEFANLDGVKLIDESDYSYTHVKEIANTGLLVSVHHRFDKSANLEVFDVSQKGQTKKIYSFEEISEDIAGRCRWSSNPDEPLLYVKYDARLLNIVDTEKKALILKSPVEIDSEYLMTSWIDVCQSNGNILAAGGSDRNVKIFDKRESSIVQTVDDIHTSNIYCVRWSPSGDMIASASHDKTAALLDFKTGKNLYTGKTSDGQPALSVCFI